MKLTNKINKTAITMLKRKIKTLCKDCTFHSCSGLNEEINYSYKRIVEARKDKALIDDTINQEIAFLNSLIKNNKCTKN